MKKRSLPDRRGFFGEFGGQFVPETLMAPLAEFSDAYREARRDRTFRNELAALLHDFVGRPTPITEARRFASECGAIRLFLKREDLNHTGAHKINNAIGQALLAKRMGKDRVIAETGAGQHGVATATACALLGLECVVYMGTTDIERQAPNVDRMRLLGARVVAVSSGSQTLKDAVNEAIRDWVTNIENTHYVIGSALGPHPYPMIVRDFQSVIGREALRQMNRITGKTPDVAIASVGGGSNAIGLFYPMIESSARLIGVEAGGRGSSLGDHAARFSGGTIGVLHGSRSLILQDSDGQISATHSISAGLDYPSVGPEHAYYASLGRIEFGVCDDELALEAFHRLAELEGIIPALESSHALGWLLRNGRSLPHGSVVVANLSGRGDKDLAHVAKATTAARPAVLSFGQQPPHDSPRREEKPVPLRAIPPRIGLVRSGTTVRRRRLATMFSDLRRDHRCGLIAYVTCGDPDAATTINIVRALADAGADAIELGIPFSDPIADGPVIQQASERALRNGTTTDDVFTIAAAIREFSEIPLIAFSYLNPILRYGEERFSERARESGIDSLLITDLPPDAAADLRAIARRNGLGLTALVAPTTPLERMSKIDRATDDFIYCVSTNGVTGARGSLDVSLIARLQQIRDRVSHPLAVGFGISTHDQYRALAGHCDCVVVGSAIVKAIADGAAADAPTRAASVVQTILGKDNSNAGSSIDDLSVAALEAARQ